MAISLEAHPIADASVGSLTPPAEAEMLHSREFTTEWEIPKEKDEVVELFCSAASKTISDADTHFWKG